MLGFCVMKGTKWTQSGTDFLGVVQTVQDMVFI
jgi:hypothetical protein